MSFEAKREEERGTSEALLSPLSSILPARSAGVLLHPSSLPGPDGIGTLGAEARRFVRWLEQAGQSVWQILPLVPVDAGGSPYSGLSAMAGNPVLVDLEELVALGLLDAEDAHWDGRAAPVDYERLVPWKEERLRRACDAFRRGQARHLRAPLEAFRQAHRGWLEDYALFRALRERHDGAPWTRWPARLRDRDPDALQRWSVELRDAVDRHVFAQFLFDRQWRALREYAGARGVRIFGDLPIFVAHDSADVWAHRELFQLDASGEPEVVSGVPPDYFSETGQRWGNPLYRWDMMHARGYRWWTRRMRQTLDWVDLVRVDHFRGFEAYWQIPADEPTAVNGEWREGPGEPFFRALERELGPLPIVAEDLGLITDEVDQLRDALGFPGMRVLQFAWDGDAANPHRPENHPENAVAYTGTHDNDTILGWWRALDAPAREPVLEQIDAAEPIGWELIRLALESAARLAVVPVQDVLGLGSAARMNTPGTGEGNWGWRLREGALDGARAARLAELAARTGRAARAGAATTNVEGSR